MAKKDKNKEVKADVAVETSEKIEENKTNPEKKKSHFGRNLVIFVFLLLVGATAFSAIQLKQTEALNKQAMRELQNDYEQKLSAVDAKVNGLQKEMAQIKNMPTAAGGEGVSEEFVNRRLEQLKQELMQYQPAEKGEAVASQTVVIENASAAQTREVLLASGALIVRDLAEQGNKFEYETEVLQILAQGNPQAEKYVSVMQKYAVSGLKGKSQLMQSFNRIFADLNEAEVKSKPEEKAETEEPQGWKDKVIAWMKNIFVVEKSVVHPVFKEKEDEVYILVNEGNLGEALNALNASEKYAKIESSALAQWKSQVADYMEFTNAVTGLIMNSIANLHLKEMEH